MDFSNEYMKMSKMADEIQKYFLEQENLRHNLFMDKLSKGGNYTDTTTSFLDKTFYAREFEGHYFLLNDSSIRGMAVLSCDRENTFVLPRIDQLIMMVGDGHGLFGGYTDFIDDFEKHVAKMIDRFWQKDRFRYTSFEQLFIMFVMNVKYDKLWDKEGWGNANVQST